MVSLGFRSHVGTVKRTTRPHPRPGPAPPLNCANAAPHGTDAAALDHDGLTQGWRGATQSYRDAELAQRKGAAKHLLRTLRRRSAGG